MKIKSLYIVIAALLLFAILGIYGISRNNYCTFGSSAHQTEVGKQTNQTKIQTKKNNQTLFIGCNGIF